MNVDNIKPDEKDLMRARNMSYRGNSFYGSGAPFASKAQSMAKLIKDKKKLVRRSKAVVAIWGIGTHTGFIAGKPVSENVWQPFKEALIRHGFSDRDILSIAEYEDENPLGSLGLEDILF